MAAQDDGARDDKPADAQRKSRARRPRAPVTIDLTAERVAATEAEAPQRAAAPAKPEPEPARPAAAPEPAAAPAAALPAGDGGEPAKSEAPRTTRPPGASIIGSDDGWTRAALAGVAGGVVALILIIVLQAIGLLPSPGRSAALQAADQAKAVSETAAALDRRLSAVEMIAQNLPSRSAVDVLGGQIAELNTDVGARARQDDLTGLENKLAALTRKVDGLPAGATRDELAALAERVTGLEAGGTAGNGGSGAGADAVAALAHRIDQLQTSANALGNRVAALEDGLAAGPSDSALAARAIAIAALRRAVDEGGPFISDLDLAAALGLPADTVAQLRPFARTGVATKAALAVQFRAVGDEIVRAAAQADPDAGFFDRLLAGISSLVTVRPAGPVAGDDAAAIVSRMRAAVDAGDLEAALRERNSLPAAGRDASADWTAAAWERVTVDGLIVRIAQTVTPAAGN